MNTNLTIQQLQTRFLEEVDLAETTKVVYKIAIRLFFRWMVKQGKDLRQPSRVDVMQYKTSCKQKLSPLTTDLYMNSLKSFFKWLELSGINDNVTTHIRNEKKVNDFTKLPITASQVNDLISSIPANGLTNLRDRAIISLLYFNALRVVEVWRLNVSDVDYNRKQIWIIGKGRTQREAVAVNDTVLSYIAAYLDQIHTAAYYPLFQAHNQGSRNEVRRIAGKTIGIIVSKRMAEAGVKEKGVSAHSLRHSAAVHMIDSGADLYTVQLFLRHTDSNTSRIYTRYAEKSKIIADAPTKALESKYLTYASTRLGI